MTERLYTGFKDVMGKAILVGDLLMYPTSCSSHMEIHFSIVTGLTKNGKKLLVETIEPLPWGTSLFYGQPVVQWVDGEKKLVFVEDVYFKSVWIDRVDRSLVLAFEHTPFEPCLTKKLTDEIFRVRQEWQTPQ